MAKLKAKTNSSRGNLRIIAGRHRGRKLTFPLTEGIRPTPDRVRETVFNWLAGVTEGACCLDLFCGSGALGLEALSRSAHSVTFIDYSAKVIQNLQSQLKIMQEPATVYHQQAMAWLAEQPPKPVFDIVFLDPPFNQDLLQPICQRIAEKRLVKPGGYVYIEAEATLKHLPLPDHWHIQKQKQAGDLRYALCHIH